MTGSADIPVCPDSNIPGAAAAITLLLYTLNDISLSFSQNESLLLQMRLKMRLITRDCHVEMSHAPAIGNVPISIKPGTLTIIYQKLG